MKFRIWLKGLERFATDEWYLDPEGRVYFENIMDGVLERASENSYVVQRSTGLLDKKGVEIYEGDALNIFNHHQPEEVEYLGSSFGFFLHDEARMNGCFEELGNYTGEDGLEIIGNIFDK